MRKKLRKRILVFSIIVTFIFLILAIGIFTAFEIVRPYLYEMKNLNSDAIGQIEHKENVYDTNRLINKPSYEGSDYILTKERFFIWFSNDYPGFSLNFSEPNFIRGFRIPADYNSPTNERWRLYSRNKLIDHRDIEIMVGLEEKSQERIFEISASPETDQKLKGEADKIANSLKIEKGKVSLSSEFRTKIDAYQVVDVEDKKVIDWSWLLPAFFPKEKTLPHEGPSFFKKKDNEIFLVRTDYGNDLIVVSL
jgi:hypothetical protein